MKSIGTLLRKFRTRPKPAVISAATAVPAAPVAPVVQVGTRQERRILRDRFSEMEKAAVKAGDGARAEIARTMQKAHGLGP